MRALDNLDPQVHPGGRAARLSRRRRRAAGRRRPRPRGRRRARSTASTPSCTSPRPSASGQSMYEIERYTSINAIGAAVRARGGRRAARRRSRKLLVASSMSIYGEGQYRNPRDGRVRARARGCGPRASSPRASGSVLADDGDAARARADRRDEAAAARPPSTRSASATTRRWCSPSAPRTASRRSRSASSTSTASGRRSRTRTPACAAIFSSRLLNDRAPLVFEDGQQTRDFIDVRDIARVLRARAAADGADGRTLNVGTGRPTSIVEVAQVIARGLGQGARAGGRERVPRRRHPPLLRRHAARQRAARLPRRDSVRGRDARSCSRGSRARRRRTRLTRRAKRSSRAASPVSARSQRLDRQYEQSRAAARLSRARLRAQTRRSSCSTTPRRTGPPKRCASAFPTSA